MSFESKLAVALLASCAALAHAESLNYELTQIEGSWAWGNTQWNTFSTDGYVDNSTDVGQVDAIFHSPYVYQAPYTEINGVYNWPTGTATLAFSVNDGNTATLSTLSVLSSRSYSDDTLVSLDYSTDHGATWRTALNTTTGELGWLYVGTAGTKTETINLSFGGVLGNAFKLSFTGVQISIHSLSVDGSAAVVPEPEGNALVLAGLGIVGLMSLRGRQAKA